MRKPAQPKAPRKPTKPTEPKKTWEQDTPLYLDMDSDGSTVQLTEIINQLPEGISIEDIFLRRTDDYDYGCCGGTTTSIDAFYLVEMENQDYNRQMLAYAKKIVKYDEKMKVFAVKLAEFEIRTTKYTKELKIWEAAQTTYTIAKLEKQLKKLKK